VKTLTEKVVSIHDALKEANIHHAFGGAIALAYCTRDPRATADIDVNVFVLPKRASDVFRAFPEGVATNPTHEAEALDRGQVRVMWDETPVDVFFAYHEFHEAAAKRISSVPFADTQIPVLECADLIVFKAIFGRPRDWVDIEAALSSGSFEVDEALERLDSVLGNQSHAFQRLASLTVPTDEADPYREAFGAPPREE
jgi:hypothetical protein